MPGIFVETCGGLGNVLFQAAAGLVLSWRHGYKCFFLEGTMSPSALGPRHTYWKTLLAQLYTTETFPPEGREAILHSDCNPVHGFRSIRDSMRKATEKQINLLLKGYYQHKDHFWPEKQSVCRVFVRAPTWNRAQERIRVESSRSGCPCSSIAFLHVRRGDYKQLQQYHPLLPANYYERAVERFDVQTKFLVFCEMSDLAESQSDFKTALPSQVYSRFIWSEEKETGLLSSTDYEQFAAMAACPRGGILANSTFSTWAAYVHDAFQSARTTVSSRFVCPKRFFAHDDSWGKEIQDPRWIRISNHKPTPSNSIFLLPSKKPMALRTPLELLRHPQSSLRPLFQIVLLLRKQVGSERCIEWISRLRCFSDQELECKKEFQRFFTIGERPKQG